ncbi:hypothetical protein ACIBI9_64280 [Nonomuraea sp. NPDC050451]|uniref:hypothetical protein n=1 Tax=Nonomuraea sp. NPDC050451 TaxID=3364364 RepID=UPI0037955B34
METTACFRGYRLSTCGPMDHSQAPILQALQAYHDSGQLPFTPPGHEQGRGVDPRVRAVLGEAVFRSDVLAVGGLDDRASSGGVLEQAQQLMADAVGAGQTFFSTCGSSLSVKAAMLSVAGPREKLLIGRDAHKSVVAGLILSGICPVWVEPQWDEDLHLAHPHLTAGVRRRLRRASRCARRSGGDALAGDVRSHIEAIEGLHLHGRDDFCGPGRAFDADPLQLVVDVSALGTGGYQIADWLREHHRINVGLADHRRIGVQLTHADDSQTIGTLLDALQDLRKPATELPPPPRVQIPRRASCGWSRPWCPVMRSLPESTTSVTAGSRSRRRGTPHALPARHSGRTAGRAPD